MRCGTGCHRWGWSRRGLPSERCQSRNHGKVRVPGRNRQIPLAGDRRDPEVIVWNGLAQPRELGFENRVRFSGALFGQQRHDRPDKGADFGESFPWRNRSLSAKKEFAGHYPRNIDTGKLGEASE
jgi:hypothetical protein